MTGTITEMTLDDVGDVADVHLRSFPGFFLTFLGNGFLRELYHNIVRHPSGLAFVFKTDDRVAGFVAGTTQPAGFYRSLIRRRWWRFALAALPAAIRKPAIVFRLFHALSMPGEVTTEKDRGTLLSIAVLPAEQSKGIGHQLVNVFLEKAAERGLQKVDLTTDRLENDPVNAFYLRLGFTCSRSFVTPAGREMNEYVISLTGKKSS
jgi:ribosomal protein S18 acetylase RimI-like enzyme